MRSILLCLAPTDVEWDLRRHDAFHQRRRYSSLGPWRTAQRISTKTSRGRLAPCSPSTALRRGFPGKSRSLGGACQAETAGLAGYSRRDGPTWLQKCLAKEGVSAMQSLDPKCLRKIEEADYVVMQCPVSVAMNASMCFCVWRFACVFISLCLCASRNRCRTTTAQLCGTLGGCRASQVLSLTSASSCPWTPTHRSGTEPEN